MLTECIGKVMMMVLKMDMIRHAMTIGTGDQLIGLVTETIFGEINSMLEPIIIIQEPGFI